MLSPMFDGQYRSKPQVSLRGASRQEERRKLVQRAHLEREKRELVRRQQHAAITIQAHYRGHVHRQNLYSQLRAEFDTLCAASCEPPAVLALSRLLLIFYQEHTDRQRLVAVCQQWLHFRHELAAEACTSAICSFHLQHMLARCCLTLRACPSQPLALPLRMLEVYLGSCYPPEYQASLTARLYAHLISNCYFSALRHILEQRVPPPEDPSPASSPLADSLLDYITRPLLSGWEDTRLYAAVASELLSPPLTPHICYLLLPRLQVLSLPVQFLLHSLDAGSIDFSPELLYGLLQLVHSRLGTLPQSSLAKYLHLLANLLSHMPSKGHVMSDDWAVELDADDDILEGDSNPLGSSEELLACCVATLLGEELPVRIRQERELRGALLDGLCALCYRLTLLNSTEQSSQARFFQLLALTPSILLTLWTNITALNLARSFGEPVSCLQQLARGLVLPQGVAVALMEQLSTFTTLFFLYLSTLHDAEFYREVKGSHMPFAVSQLVAMVTLLRDCFLSLHMERHLPHTISQPKRPVETTPTSQEWHCLKQGIHRLLCHLYERDCRRPFCPPGHWEVLSMQKIPPELFVVNEEESPTAHVSASALKQARLLQIAPFVFPFIERVKFFQELVLHQRRELQGHLQDFLIGPAKHVTARRNHIYEDAFSELAHDTDLRQKLRVNLVNAQGLDEPGIDGGGVFREFLSELLKTGFDPNYGFFTTAQDGLLYPNPLSHLLSEDFSLHYQFLGGMLGKALYENLLVELPFAGFFLCKLVDHGRGTVGAHHLASLDPELYRHLLSLKHYEGDIEELCLNFTVMNSEIGQSKVVELKPNGADLPVMKANCIEYIHLMAHYRLNVQIERQFQAFRRGLSAVVPLQWLRLFSQNELQVLISGARVPVDTLDLRLNTKYSGEYSAEHPCIQIFWKIVEELSEQQKRQLLKFVTSCSRPPLLGFKELYPPFCVMSGGKEDRLPSASTCMNILKLPTYTNISTMRNRLLYAIASGAGFELS